MSGAPRRTWTLVGGHLSAGIVAGTLFGCLYFVLEPLAGHWGRFELLGAPLSRILGVYLLFGLVAGVSVGFVGGALSAAFRRRWGPDRFVPVYGALFAGLLVFMYTVRHYSRTRFERILFSPEALGFLAVFAGLLAGAIFLSRVLAKKRLPGRTGSRAGWAAAGACLAFVLGVQAFASYRENRIPRGVPTADSDGPNVVLILLDALRADHLSAYGYHRDTTPAIDVLAREGVLFRNARSHGNRTIISVPSIFTSLYPSFHGTVGWGSKVRPLTDEHTTIAEVFRAKGYTTVGLMSNHYLKKGYGLGQGFDALERFYGERYALGLYKILRLLGVIERPRHATGLHADAEAVTDRGIHWLRRLERKPFFLYAHYMDTHHPYAPPPPYDSLFGAGDANPAPLDLFRKTTRWLRGSASDTLSTREIAKLKDYYDGSIRYADEEIGRLLAAARRASEGRDLVIVITSDHGDEFFEHGRFHHVNLLMEELLRVPLVFWATNGFERGAVVGGLARHIDLLPTLAELIGADTPAEAVGRSLVPMLRGEADTAQVESFAEGDYCVSLNRGDWKMVMVDSTDAFHLYNLSSDPGEAEDLSKSAKDVYLEMKARLAAYVEKANRAREASKAAETEADEETIRKLKALGYM